MEKNTKAKLDRMEGTAKEDTTFLTTKLYKEYLNRIN